MALAATALAAAGCGNDVPEGAVATVGEARIEKSEYDNWLSAAAQSQQTAGPAGQTVVPDPPDYEQCIATLREQSAPPGGQDAPPSPSPEELRQQCEQQYEALKQQVMQFLIQAEAIQQEAAARNIQISEEEVAQQLEDQKEQSFKNEQEYQEFLETSGRSEEDLLFQLRLDLLSNRIRESVVSGTPVTDTQIQAYYDQNSERPPIGEPETRDVEVVLTEDEADAQKARQEIEDGARFAEVAKKYSIDETSASNGGELEDVQEGQQEMAFDDAVFSAEEGELVGPIETEFGFYVFRVTDVQPAQQQSLEESREAITQILQSEREQAALNEFIERFEKEYTDKTVCAEGYVIQGCGNAPEDEPPASGAPPDGAPQGAPPQGAPPQGAPPQPGAPQQPGPGGLDPQQGAPPQGAPQQGAPQGPPPQGGGGPGG